ncbi:hypothetical protein K435DRAFT_779716, partial [Dendrothele bispora CBS 962.96]
MVLVPTSLTEARSIISNLHVDLGHLGTYAVSTALHERVWVPYSTELVQRVVATCNQCQFTKREPGVTQPLHPLPRVNVGDIVAFDFIGPL